MTSRTSYLSLSACTNAMMRSDKQAVDKQGVKSSQEEVVLLLWLVG